MRVLLIGGCGYVGSALELGLRERGLEVESLDLEWYGNPGVTSNVRRDFAELDAKDLVPYDSIVLLAAHASELLCARDPVGSFSNNVRNFVELLGKVSPEQRLVYASSTRVYASTNGRAAQETWDCPTPKTYYDLAKLELDQYALLSKRQVYGLRFGTVCGFAPHLRVDVMLNRMFQTARERGEIVVANPEACRPILGIQDLVRAVASVLESPRSRPGIYNLASLNARISELGARAANRLGAVLAMGPPSFTYDTRVDTKNFEDAFEFEFQETVESILDSLTARFDGASVVSSREELRPYSMRQASIPG